MLSAAGALRAAAPQIRRTAETMIRQSASNNASSKTTLADGLIQTITAASVGGVVGMVFLHREGHKAPKLI